MAANPDEIAATLARLIHPEWRGRLLASGLARGMIWRDGVVPQDAPRFPPELTENLLHFGYGILGLALELRDANVGRPRDTVYQTAEAFRVAAECIESAMRRGNPTDPSQGRHLVVSAAAFHLAGFAARSFSMLPKPALEKNLASAELALALLLRRDLRGLRSQIVGWFSDPAHADGVVANRLVDDADDFDVDDAVAMALTARYHRLLGRADSALLSGDAALYDSTVDALQDLLAHAGEAGNLTVWWAASLTKHLLRDLWDNGLHVRLPLGSNLPPRWSELRRDFINVLAARNPPQLDLWPSQLEAAARCTDATDDLVVALPTSAGKTRIAELCILRTLADYKRVVYVTPLRALSAQVERVLGRTFAPLGATVTSLYGASGATSVDTESLANASIVVSTPEKLDFALRQDPDVLDDVGLVVLDEGHMIGLGSRELRYEVLIQRLLRRGDADHRRIVCLSAMFNPEDEYFQDFSAWLKSDDPREAVHVHWRPTRQLLATLDWSATQNAAKLSFIEGEKPFVPRFLEGKQPVGRRKLTFPKNEIEFCTATADAFARDGHSVLIYSPQRSQVEVLVRTVTEVKEQGFLRSIAAPPATELASALAIGREWLGARHAAVCGLEVGVGTHHGALPRPFLSAVEDLLTRRKLPVVVASPTLAQGIDLSCSVLIFRTLERFDQEDKKLVPIRAEEFANVVGRVGRAFVDLDGIAVFPIFEDGRRLIRQKVFSDLVTGSKKQRLQSGLVRLVVEIAKQLVTILGVKALELEEYIFNQQNIWSDLRLLVHGDDAVDEAGEDEDAAIRSLDDFLADLDVAILSLLEPLDAPAETLATILDEVLTGSLWKRTLARQKVPQQTLERRLLVSRAEWLWRTTTVEQRRACFQAGLGHRAGVFLYDNLDELVALLAALQDAVVKTDSAAVGTAAVAFATRVADEKFFTLKRVPADWSTLLESWVTGVALGKILANKKTREAQNAQTFIQDGVVFKLVWAAEAVRAQAVAASHERADELGDGPALTFTHGVPSIPAALLCQAGLDSRVAALAVTQRMAGSFADLAGMNEWIRRYRRDLSLPEAWDTEDQWLLWQRMTNARSGPTMKSWVRTAFVVYPLWRAQAPAERSRVRLVPENGNTVRVCSLDLAPLGTVVLEKSVDSAAVTAIVTSGDGLRVEYFGET